jgi:hypothetical protein
MMQARKTGILLVAAAADARDAFECSPRLEGFFF